jgi:hydroxysqualene dehydroxylase
VVRPHASRIQSAIVVGAGIAGIAAAVRLSEAGVRVSLLETRKKLGGRATSFDDTRSGRVLDNCQHVVLGCCTNYMDLLARLRVDQHIQWYREQYWIEVGGRTSTIRRSPLPAPAHFAVSMLTAPMFTRGESLSLARACAAMMRADRRQHREQTFAAYLVSLGQSDRLLRRFWAPVVISACNLDLDKVAASVAMHVFQEGFLAAPSAADIGISRVPLVRLYDSASEIITGAGGDVQLGTGVQTLDARRVTTTDGQELTADAVVCAVPVERVLRVVSEPTRAGDARFDHLDSFRHSPILGVHMEFDRPVLGDLPHAVLVDRPTQWLFRKDEGGAYVHAVISAADAWLELNEDQIADRVLADLRACLPSFQPKGRADEPKLVRVRAVKEKLATFAPTPGIERYRPSVTGPSGLLLAGDYTDTGWPATMEGATRSGYAAAAAALAQSPGSLVVPSLKIAPLARLMGLKAV